MLPLAASVAVSVALRVAALALMLLPALTVRLVPALIVLPASLVWLVSRWFLASPALRLLVWLVVLKECSVAIKSGAAHAYSMGARGQFKRHFLAQTAFKEPVSARL